MNKDESLKYFMKNCIYLSKHQIFLFPCLLTNLMALNNKQGRTYCSSFPINLRKLLTIISMNFTEDLSRVIYFILVFFLENNYIRKCNIFKKLCEWRFFSSIFSSSSHCSSSRNTGKTICRFQKEMLFWNKCDIQKLVKKTMVDGWIPQCYFKSDIW